MDNFEYYVQSVQEQNEADARHRKRTREERRQHIKQKRIAWCVILTLICLALIFEFVSGFQSKSTVTAEQPEVHSTTKRTSESVVSDYKENPDEEMLIEQALLEQANVIDNCYITYYCAEPYKHICGYGLGITASGRELIPHYSCAVDPDVIPLGSQVMVDFGDGEIWYLSADDTGGAVKGNHIDICLPTHAECFEQPYNMATVYWIEGD